MREREGICTGCGEEKARPGFGDMCFDCGIKAAKRRYGLEREDNDPGGEEKGKCSRCGRPREEHGSRLYAGECADCRGKDRYRPRKREMPAPVPPAGESAGEGEKTPENGMGGGSPSLDGKEERPSTQVAGSGVIGHLLGRFNAAITEAREIHRTLATLKKYGADFEMPDKTI